MKAREAWCVGCPRRITRRRWFWRDPYGDITCAYRWAGLWLHKPRRDDTPTTELDV